VKPGTYETLFEKIREIEIIDTHEHILSREDVLRDPLHLFKVFENSYARLDFTSAGMPMEAWQSSDPASVWNVFKTYQRHVESTCFFRNIIRALQDLYGLKGDRITETDWPELSERVQAAYQRKDWYHEVLGKKARFKTSLLDTFWSVEAFAFDPDLFVPVLRTNPLILGRQFVSLFPKGLKPPTTVEILSDAWKVTIDGFEAYLALIDLAIKKYKAQGAPAVKIGTAYERILFFDKVSRNEAARLYVKRPGSPAPDDQKRLQDFMAHYIIRRATAEGLPVQIHTGILARNANVIENTNPQHLNNLFLMYPDTRFVLLHFSFPYMHEAFSLAKMFSNVYIDFCWVPMLSKRAAAQALDEYFDLVPGNKIMWGGDAFRVEEAYAGACAAKEVVTSVLADRIGRGDLDMEGAVELAHALFYGNARNLFQL